MKFGSERLKRGLAVGGLMLAAGMAGLAPSAAQARVFVNLGIGLPIIAPAPVYAPPPVAYAPYAPPVVYAAPPVAYPPAVVYAPVYRAGYYGPYWYHRYWR